MSEQPVEKMVKRTCRHCGRTFHQHKGEAKRRGCPDCEPPLIPRRETVKR